MSTCISRNWFILYSYQWDNTLVTTVLASGRFINISYDL
ncbi:hypothetical protein SLEP1_g17550 [Rubroshorea leprosula]|uniref:Uncharacterized protein n=1 Tax=Rubroshorea leprosula TaxID=152421 RepID=A0AAV5J276_9ROSI|nr:hypothetical protein SLEP1_g17550 [Rubroshorea leprosula]